MYVSLFDMVTIFAPVIVFAMVGLIAARNMRTRKKNENPVCPAEEEDTAPTTPAEKTVQSKLTDSEASTQSQSDSATVRKRSESLEESAVESEATVMDDQGSDDDGMEEVRRTYAREAAMEVGPDLHHDDHQSEEDFEVGSEEVPPVVAEKEHDAEQAKIQVSPIRPDAATEEASLLVISAFLRNLEPSQRSQSNSMRVLRRVRRCIQQRYPEVRVHAFGSAISGLGDETCDIDIDLAYPIPEGAQRRDAHQSQQNMLVAAADYLTHQGFTLNMIALGAKVPVATLVDSDTKRSVDITVNNGLPVYNTRLLRYYSKLYPSGLVPKLVLLVKYWAKTRDVVGAKGKYLSSYALTLMVIYYLQAGREEECAPSFQAIAHRIREGIRSYVHEEREYDVSMVSSTTSMKYWNMPSPEPNLDMLLRGFFDFYANRFDFSKDVVSVRIGRGATRSQVTFHGKHSEHLGGLCWIEDPIDTGRNLNCVLTEQTFKVFQAELRMAATVLASRQTTLTQLLPTPPQQASVATKAGEWGDEPPEQYSKSWSNDAHTDLWSPANDQARGPGADAPSEYWGPGSAGKGAWKEQQAWGVPPKEQQNWGGPPKDQQAWGGPPKDQQTWPTKDQQTWPTKDQQTWSDDGMHWNGPAGRDQRDEWREWEKWERDHGKGKGKGQPVKGNWDSSARVAQDRRDPAEWEMRKPPQRTNTWAPAPPPPPQGAVWPPQMGRASAPANYISSSFVPFQLPVQVLPTPKPEEKAEFEKDKTFKTEKVREPPKKAKGEGKTKPVKDEQKPGSAVPRPTITKTADRGDEATDTKSREIAFAKVMQHLDPFESQKESKAPKKQPAQVMNMLLQPEQDVQEVLRAPAALIERRLWEKLYNRALFSGCTHRQALSVTERILKRGQADAIKILASPALMEQESQHVLNAAKETS